MGVYTAWTWTAYPTFRRYILPPSAMLNGVGWVSSSTSQTKSTFDQWSSPRNFSTPQGPTALNAKEQRCQVSTRTSDRLGTLAAHGVWYTQEALNKGRFFPFTFPTAKDKPPSHITKIYTYMHTQTSLTPRFDPKMEAVPPKRLQHCPHPHVSNIQDP